MQSSSTGLIAEEKTSPSIESTFQSREQLNEKLQQLKTFYRAKKLFQASRVLSSLNSDIDELKTSSSTSLKQTAHDLETKLSTPPFLKIQSLCAQVAEVQDGFADSGDWTVSYNGEVTKVWYRKHPRTGAHSILIEGEIRAPFLHVAALMYESDLYDRLFWYVTSAKMLKLKDESPWHRAAHIEIFAPWPLNKRDIAVYAFAVDGLDEDDCVMVVTNSINDLHPVAEKVPSSSESSRNIRVDLQTSGFVLLPETPGVTKAKFLYNIDPQLAFVPMALVNWIARMICRWSIKMLETRAQDLNALSPVYEERMRSHSFYEIVRRRLDEFWNQKGISPASESENHSRPSTSGRRRSTSFDPEEKPQLPSATLLSSLARRERTESESVADRVKHLFGGSRK